MLPEFGFERLQSVLHCGDLLVLDRIQLNHVQHLPSQFLVLLLAFFSFAFRSLQLLCEMTISLNKAQFQLTHLS